MVATNRSSLTVEDYYPENVKVLLRSLDDKIHYWVCLVGFGETMKWLTRLLSEIDRDLSLHDWREKFWGYDCYPHTVESLEIILQKKNPLIVICSDELDQIKHCIQVLVNSELRQIPTILGYSQNYNPIRQEYVYQQIITKAEKVAKSLNTDNRLFNLVQLVRETRFVSGDIVELGSFSGGTGAVIVESMKHWGSNPEKNVWLFDSYQGIPPSNLGIDYRWSGMFSNVSFSEVKDGFSKYCNVRLVKGPIEETIGQINFPISLAHIDIDTYEGVKLATERIWPLVTEGGVILYDDFGFFPNCLPLTTYVATFAEQQSDAFKFYLPSNGYFLIKRNQI